MKNKLMNWLLTGVLIAGASIGCWKQESKEPLEKRVTSAQVETPPLVGPSVPEITEANKYLRGFPEQIRGAGKIEKHETLGAKYCLVHVKQTHFVNLGAGKLDPSALKFYESQMLEPANKIQKDLADILISFISEGRKEIYSEGLCSSYTSSQSALEYSIRNSHIAKKLGITPNEVMKKYPYISGAEYILSATGNVKLLPADSRELNATALRTKTKKAMCDDREDHFLKTMADSGKTSSIVVYGSAHNFYDNIELWNKKNPDKKISLIEVVPKSYSEVKKDE
jgi:hypothetical protein